MYLLALFSMDVLVLDQLLPEFGRAKKTDIILPPPLAPVTVVGILPQTLLVTAKHLPWQFLVPFFLSILTMTVFGLVCKVQTFNSSSRSQRNDCTAETSII